MTKPIAITRNVFWIPSTGYSSNVYLVKGNDEFAIIDVGLPRNYQIVVESISRLDLIGKKGLIILTHMHYDHIGATKKVSSACNLPVAIHKNEKIYLENGDSFYTVALLFGENEIEPIDVDYELLNGDSFNLGKSVLEIIHTPGHTFGSIVIYDRKNKILFSGDTVFSSGSFGRTDLPTGNIYELVDSLKKLSRLDVEILCPGHGDVVYKNASNQIKLALKYALSIM